MKDLAWRISAAVLVLFSLWEPHLINWQRVSSRESGGFGIWPPEQRCCTCVWIQLCHHCSFSSFFLPIKLHVFVLTGSNAGSRRLHFAVVKLRPNCSLFCPTLLMAQKNRVMMMGGNGCLWHLAKFQIEVLKSGSTHAMVIMDSDFHKELTLVTL